MTPDHERKGYSAGSSGYRHGCRCPQCKASNSGYQRTHRVKSSSEKAPREIRIKPAPEAVQRVISTDPEPVASMRDETIPGQIMVALGCQDFVSYVDGGEGWSLAELAMYLQATENVDCVIQDDVLYVSTREDQPSYASIHDDYATVFIPSQVAVIALNTGPAKPRVVARASAPSVPNTPMRAPNT